MIKLREEGDKTLRFTDEEVMLLADSLFKSWDWKTEKDGLPWGTIRKTTRITSTYDAVTVHFNVDYYEFLRILACGAISII